MPARTGTVSLLDRKEQSAVVEDLFSRVPVSADQKARLHAMMSDPSRLYHGLGHLATLWDRHLNFRSSEMDRRYGVGIACAVAFHDCVYEAGRRDNEERSADWWLQASARSEIDDDTRRWVADTIRWTADHLGFKPRAGRGTTPAEAARLWVLDLDLTPLGEEAHVYDANSEALFREAGCPDHDDWRRGLLSFLGQFQNVPVIYRSPALAERFETPARANIRRTIDWYLEANPPA